jgi:hypothetical protein
VSRALAFEHGDSEFLPVQCKKGICVALKMAINTSKDRDNIAPVPFPRCSRNTTLVFSKLVNKLLFHGAQKFNPAYAIAFWWKSTTKIVNVGWLGPIL